MSATPNIWIEKTKPRYFFFSLICFGYLVYGCNITLMGIAFEDLTAILDVDSKNVAYGITIRYVANCFAAILAGLSFNLFSRQIQYAVALSIYGLLMIVLPLVENKLIYFISSGAIGLASAFIDCATNLWAFELFAKNINTHVLIVHFCYSVGSTISPMIIKPYLSNLSANETYTPDNKAIREATNIQVPFFICGSFFLIAAFLIVFCYIVKPYIPPKRFVESKDVVELVNNEDNAEEDLNGEKKAKSPLPAYYYNSFFVIISLILGFEIANELNLNYYLPTYLHKSSLSVSQDVTADMMSLIGASYCAGRLFNILTSFKIDVRIMLYINLALIISGNLILTFFAQATSISNVWISVILLGLGYSSLFPNLFSFIEQRITVTNTLNSFLVFVTSTVFMVNSLVIGNSIDDNPSLYQYLNLSFSILFIVLFFVLHSTDLWKKRILRNIKTVN